VQPVGVPLDDVQELDALRGEPPGFPLDQLAEGDDRGQRRAQLVRHDGQELVPGLVELEQPFVLLGQLTLGLLGQRGVRALGVEHLLALFFQGRAF
jgi:hypothetical protein